MERDIQEQEKWDMTTRQQLGRITRLYLQHLQARTSASGDMTKLVLSVVVDDNGRGVTSSSGRTACGSLNVCVEGFRALGGNSNTRTDL
jgi:hypothetical protein